MKLEKIKYNKLKPRQQENYNFHKVSAVLAEYGFTSIRLNDDWQGADFIAQHVDGAMFMKVQLKGRMTIEKKYLSKDLYICFPYKKDWYLYPHDEVVEYLLETTRIGRTSSWKDKGAYSWNVMSKVNVRYFLRYKL